MGLFDTLGCFIASIFSVSFFFWLIFSIAHLFQELEKSLKTTCEEFIMSITKLVVDPMLSFVTKVVKTRLLQTSKSLGFPFCVSDFKNLLVCLQLLCAITITSSHEALGNSCYRTIAKFA
jgi:hypothetical protein